MWRARSSTGGHPGCAHLWAAVNCAAGAFVYNPQEASAVSRLGPRLQLLGQVEVLFYNCRRSCPPPAPAHARRIPRHCCRPALGQLPGAWGSCFTSGHALPPEPVPAPDTRSSHGCLWKRHPAVGEVRTGTRWSQAQSGQTPDHTGDCTRLTSGATERPDGAEPGRRQTLPEMGTSRRGIPAEN